GEPVSALTEKVFLVTPRWSPDGRQLLVSGQGGIGLSLIELADRSRSEIDPLFVGEALFSPDGKTLALRWADGLQQEYAVGNRQLRPAIAPPRPAPELPEPANPGSFVPTQDPLQLLGSPPAFVAGELLFDSPYLRVWFDPYRGTVEAETTNGTRQVADAGAWGVQVSVQGRIAYCLGHLPDASLHLYDLQHGHRDLGRGAQPAWSSDGSQLVFTLAEWAPEGGPAPQQAELYLHDLPLDRTVRLTATPEVAEMQPAFSPRGDRLAFADWRSGQVLVARWHGAPPPGEQVEQIRRSAGSR
ncbi:MAG: hypothetical protein FJ125_03045, partial [Deltaproteobacteria bacterium]|nr:hypothetical protein [Deltaproteobacteria bacterium]